MTRPLGVRVQRVQRVQKVQRVVVGGCAASLYKTFIIALAGEGKPYNRAYGAGKCTPSAACGGVSPRGGDLLYAFPCANFSCSIYSVAKTSPSGGTAI